MYKSDNNRFMIYMICTLLKHNIAWAFLDFISNMQVKYLDLPCHFYHTSKIGTEKTVNYQDHLICAHTPNSPNILPNTWTLLFVLTQFKKRHVLLKHQSQLIWVFKVFQFDSCYHSKWKNNNWIIELENSKICRPPYLCSHPQ